MKVSLNWLTDYVDVSGLAAEELAAALTRIGLCCDEIEQTATDVIFNLDITSNRPDCLGHIGVARELSAALELPLTLPDLSKVPSGPRKARDLTDVKVLDPDLCPRYTARVITGVKIGPSPAWMVERLQAGGLRSINNVVDATNYVLLEYSQPLHAFDYDLLAGNRIVVRRARQGEELVSIDGTRCRLAPEMLIIADAERPVAIAGIMGGVSSEVGQKSAAILLESAQFDPQVTRRTARALVLMTEASYRFERGLDPVGVDAASLRAAQLILQTAGGELAEGVVDVWAAPFRPPEVTMRTDRCRALLGIDVADAEQARVLARLGLSPRPAPGRITCAIPPWRGDLTREADLIEEVARLHGYDKIPARRQVSHAVVPPGEAERRRSAARDALSAAGFHEAVTPCFVDDGEAALFGFQGGPRADSRVRKTDNLLRPTLLASLLRACKTNQDAGNEQVSLYELAAVFRPGPTGTEGLPAERTELALVTTGPVRRVRGALDAVAGQLAPAAPLTVASARAAGLAEDAAAEVRLAGQPIGIIGLVSDQALDYYGLESPHAVAAIDLEALLAHAPGQRTFRPLPRFPGVRRDLSVVVDERVAWAELAEAVRSTNQPALAGLDYVGTYRGRQIPPGKKSVTLTLTYRLAEETLRHDQVDEMVAGVLAALKTAFQAELRT